MSVSVVTADTAVPGTMTRTEHRSLSMGKPLALCAPLDSRGKPLALCAPLDSSCQPCNLSQSHVAWAKLRPKTSRLCLLHLRWNSPPIDHNTVWGWGVSQMHLLTNTCTAHTLTSPPHHYCNHPTPSHHPHNTQPPSHHPHITIATTLTHSHHPHTPHNHPTFSHHPHNYSTPSHHPHMHTSQIKGWR